MVLEAQGPEPQHNHVQEKDGGRGCAQEDLKKSAKESESPSFDAVPPVRKRKLETNDDTDRKVSALRF